MFFYASKLFWTVAAPSNFALIVAFTALILQSNARTARAGRRLGIAVIVACTGIAIFPVGDLLRAPLEDRFPAPAALPDKIDGIIVLGGAVDTVLSSRRGQAVLNDGAERLVTLAALARRYPDAKIVYSGGSGSALEQEHKETDVVRRVLTDLGMEPGRVTFESNSRNTYENAVFSKALAQPRAGETWLLVTSAYHMPRSVGIFRAIGWAVLPLPVDYRTGGIGRLVWPLNLHDGFAGLEIALREWVGLLVYWITGRSQSLFPSP